MTVILVVSISWYINLIRMMPKASLYDHRTHPPLSLRVSYSAQSLSIHDGTIIMQMLRRLRVTSKKGTFPHFPLPNGAQTLASTLPQNVGI